MPTPTFRTIRELGTLSGARIFLRVDFNVPVVNGQIVDDFRIRAVMPTITLLKKAGAKVVLISHYGRNHGSDLKPVSDHLKKNLPHTYLPTTDLVVIGEHINDMEPGDVTLLGNLRLWHGEEANDEYFAIDFCRLGDIYINEAFSVSHRNHASIVRFPKLLKSAAGLRFEEEVKHLSKAFAPKEPFLVILGGAKFETKEPLVQKFINSATKVFIGGALANDFFKARGYEVGSSLVSNLATPISKELLDNPKLLLPIDVTVKSSGGALSVKKPEAVLPADRIVDMGPASVDMLYKEAERAKLILWNGPMGIYEEGMVTQTEELGIVVAESEAVSLVGGGDTFAAMKRLSLEGVFDFASTGGGAMLEFLLKETLPGIDALSAE